MIYDLIGNGFSMDTVINLLVRVFTVFCILPIHEYAHALTAVNLGDDTPRLQGRLSMNPLAHLDIFGSLMILLCGFGYAKPVSINPRNFKNPKAGMALTALAGPGSNILLSVIFAVLANCANIWNANTGSTFAWVTVFFCMYAALINISLALFNLIPIPPLDGSRILNVVLPPKYYFGIMKYERYIMIGLFVLMVTGIFSRPFGALCNLVMTLIFRLVGIPFGSAAVTLTGV